MQKLISVMYDDINERIKLISLCMHKYMSYNPIAIHDIKKKTL